MANNKQGQNAVRQALSTSTTSISQNQRQDGLKVVSGRVDSIILDENSDGFESWNDIGRIAFTPVDTEYGNDSFSTAYPIDSNRKNLPLVGEVVLIFKLTNPPLGNIKSDLIQYFYLRTLNLYNHPHHNADPNLTLSDSEFNFGGTFVERGNIHPLLPFTGDTILESRYGSSIRLGNTSQTDSEYANNWSETGESGDPITIIRNGQPDNVAEEGWLPIVEKIDEDKSSIYLTSTQQIPLTSATTNYSAVRQTPEVPNAYSSNQVILNSGRLVFNSNVDSILLSSQKTVTISANEDIGLTSEQNVALVGTEIKLGRADARESVILGDSFFDQFETLLSKLSSLASALEVLNDFPGGAPIPNLIVNSSAADVKAEIATLRSRLPQLKSQITKTV